MVAKGDRVQMTGVMANDPTPLAVGEEGTVETVFNAGTPYAQISVKWDSGRSLILLPEDPFRVVPDALDADVKMRTAVEADAAAERDGYGYGRGR